MDELAQVVNYTEPSFFIENEIENDSINKSTIEQVASFSGGLKIFHDYLKHQLYKNRVSIDSAFDYNILFTISKLGELEVDSIMGESKFSSIIQ